MIQHSGTAGVAVLVQIWHSSYCLKILVNEQGLCIIFLILRKERGTFFEGKKYVNQVLCNSVKINTYNDFSKIRNKVVNFLF